MSGVSNLLQVSERHLQMIRWVLTIGWLILIVSLFWNPISPFLINPNIDSNQCIQVQGNCLVQQPQSIALWLFWTIVVPSSIFILLFFGHETWRRICPLSFLSQIPRTFGIQRQRKSDKSRNGATRYELVKIRKDSWLGKYHLYVQFGFLILGLTARILWINSDRLALAVFLMLTILAAIVVGYLYEGKSWCQYFCPMAPVQLVFTGPRGLLGSEAHLGQRQAVTQSMCRTIDKDGTVKSACVGCQSPCMDIDAERTYWETENKPGRRFVQYGYVGLLIGFFSYSFLYAGNFDYLFSGAWLREAHLFTTLFSPGFYIAGQAIAIPKLIAVPLTLMASVGISYTSLVWLEKALKIYWKSDKKTVSRQEISHLLFSLCTFFSFNLFFFFSSRSLLDSFPISVNLLFNGLIVLISTLWLARTSSRSADLYFRESLANSLRRQLSKLPIDFSRFLEGRSMEDLKAEEIYVLAKVLPGVNQEQSLQVYKGVLRETLEQGNADSASSLQVLRPIRQELNIKDEDHFAVLTELSSVEPELLDPKKRRTRESQLRLESYRQALASMLLDLVDSGMSLQEAVQRQKKQIQFLKLEYGMTTEEEDEVLSQLLAGEKSTILRKAETLLEQMQQLAFRYQVLNQAELQTQTPVFKFLCLVAVQQKQHIIAKQMLGLLEMLGDSSETIELANSTRTLASNVLPEILQTPDGSLSWRDRLHASVLAILEVAQPHMQYRSPALNQLNRSAIGGVTAAKSEPASSEILPGIDANSLPTVLNQLLHEFDPLVQTLALYGLNLIDSQAALEAASQTLNLNHKIHWLVEETAQDLLEREQERTENQVQTLIAQVTIAGKTEKHIFQQPVVRVGSNSANDIVITDAKVAPHHTIFFLSGEEFSILDLGSGNGIYIGSRRLHNDHDRLSQGQTVWFGCFEEPAITIQWEKRSLRSQTFIEKLSTLDKVLLLFESRFFHTLKPDALIELGHNATVKIYARGERMCQAGDLSDAILLLINGTADVVVQRGETMQVVGTVNAGETIGEMGVLTRQRRSASVISASDFCRVLVIQADKFDAVLRQDPEIARNLLVVLSSRLQSLTSKIKVSAKA